MIVTKPTAPEDFNREKLTHAVRAACPQRPVDAEQVSMLVRT